MGETHSQPLSSEYQAAPTEHHTLIEQIVSDIADGNEGDILDMQTKQAFDQSQPHPWQQHKGPAVLSQHTLSTAQESLGHSGSTSPRGKLHSPKQFFGKGPNILRKSKTTPKESLKDDFNREEEFVDENTFRQEIKRSHTETNEDGYVKQEDTYEEFITKMVE